MEELVAFVAQKTGLPSATVRVVLSATCDGLISGLRETGRVELTDFGVFEVRERRARKGRNPRTGDSLQIPASYYAAFQAGYRLRKGLASRSRPAGEPELPQEWDEWAD